MLGLELASLLLFEVVAGWDGDWAREVHRHTSITKAGQTFVLFRNRRSGRVLAGSALFTQFLLRRLSLYSLQKTGNNTWNTRLQQFKIV